MLFLYWNSITLAIFKLNHYKIDYFATCLFAQKFRHFCDFVTISNQVDYFGIYVVILNKFKHLTMFLTMTTWIQLFWYVLIFHKSSDIFATLRTNSNRFDNLLLFIYWKLTTLAIFMLNQYNLVLAYLLRNSDISEIFILIQINFFIILVFI